MVWYFYQSQNKLQKKKGKIKQTKLVNVTWRPGEAGPPSPAGPQGQGRLLPPTAHPSCSVECHRASRAAVMPPACLESSPRHLLTPGDAQRLPQSIPPPPRAPSSPLSPISSPPEE